MREDNTTWGMHVLYAALAALFLIEACMFASYLFGVIL